MWSLGGRHKSFCVRICVLIHQDMTKPCFKVTLPETEFCQTSIPCSTEPLILNWEALGTSLPVRHCQAFGYKNEKRKQYVGFSVPPGFAENMVKYVGPREWVSASASSLL